MHSHHLGPQYRKVKQILRSVISVLEGQCPLEWHFQTKRRLSFGRSWKLIWVQMYPLHVLENERRRRMIYFLQQVTDMKVTSVTHLQKVNQHSCGAIPEIDFIWAQQIWHCGMIWSWHLLEVQLWMLRGFLLSCCAWHQHQNHTMFSVYNGS